MIGKEINRAQSLYGRYGQALLHADGLGDLFERYWNAIRNTQEVMNQVRIIETCSGCACEGSGSCCFQGVEEWYDHVLLLMNLVLGIQLPECGDVPNGCLFLGSRGCRLLARHSFCVNYLCPSLKELIKTPHMETLLSVSGDELYHGWQVEQTVRKWLDQHRD
jgi:hypothetical protein